MSNEPIRFGALLKITLKALKLRYKDLLDLMDTEYPVDPSIVSKWVKSVARPTQKNYDEIVIALCKKVDALVECGYQDLLDILHRELIVYINSSQLSHITKINLLQNQATKELLQALFTVVYFLDKPENNSTVAKIKSENLPCVAEEVSIFRPIVAEMCKSKIEAWDGADPGAFAAVRAEHPIPGKRLSTHKYLKFLMVPITLLVAIFIFITFDFKTDQTIRSFAGIWEIYEFDYLKIVQNGADISGTYQKRGDRLSSYKKGEIYGKVINNKVIGVWSEADPDKNSEKRGEVEISLSKDGKAITLKWRNAFNNNWYNVWSGKKSSLSPTKKTRAQAKLLPPTKYLCNYAVKCDVYGKYNSTGELVETFNIFGHVFEKPAKINHLTYQYNDQNYTGILYKKSAKFLESYTYYDSEGYLVEVQKWIGYYTGTVRLKMCLTDQTKAD